MDRWASSSACEEGLRRARMQGRKGGGWMSFAAFDVVFSAGQTFEAETDRRSVCGHKPGPKREWNRWLAQIQGRCSFQWNAACSLDAN